MERTVFIKNRVTRTGGTGTSGTRVYEPNWRSRNWRKVYTLRGVMFFKFSCRKIDLIGYLIPYIGVGIPLFMGQNKILTPKHGYADPHL